MILTENQLAVVVRALKVWPALARGPRIRQAQEERLRDFDGAERHVYVTDAQSEISRRQLRRPDLFPELTS